MNADLSEDYDEEELLIYSEFDTVLEDSIFQNNNLLKFVALESEEPFIQIGPQIYSGKWTDTVGTYLFFEPEPAPPPVDPLFSDVSNLLLNYKFKTRKCLEISRVFINQRCNDDNSENLHAREDKETLDNSSIETNQEKDSSLSGIQCKADYVTSKENISTVQL